MVYLTFATSLGRGLSHLSKGSGMKRLRKGADMGAHRVGASRRKRLGLTGFAVALSLLMTGCGLMGPDENANYPAADIEYVIPYNPGGGADPAGRQYSESLAEAYGININVLNQPGADEAIGITRLSTANPDGYTLGMGTSGGFLGQPIANPDVEYDGLEDFDPIT